MGGEAKLTRGPDAACAACVRVGRVSSSMTRTAGERTSRGLSMLSEDDLSAGEHEGGARGEGGMMPGCAESGAGSWLRLGLRLRLRLGLC